MKQKERERESEIEWLLLLFPLMKILIFTNKYARKKVYWRDRIDQDFSNVKNEIDSCQLDHRYSTLLFLFTMGKVSKSRNETIKLNELGDCTILYLDREQQERISVDRDGWTR